MNQESFIKQHITNTTKRVNKQIRDNREKEMTEVMYPCLTGKLRVHNLMLPNVNDLRSLNEQKMTKNNKWIGKVLAELLMQHLLTFPSSAVFSNSRDNAST